MENILETIFKDLKEFGWHSQLIKSPVNDTHTLITYFDTLPDNYRIPITFKIENKFLYVITNKLFKINNSAKALLFLEKNDYTPGGKWIGFPTDHGYFVEYGFEILIEDYTQKFLFYNLDLLTVNIERMIHYQKDKDIVDKTNYTTSKVITKDSLNLM